MKTYCFSEKQKDRIDSSYYLHYIRKMESLKNLGKVNAQILADYILQNTMKSFYKAERNVQ